MTKNNYERFAQSIVASLREATSDEERKGITAAMRGMIVVFKEDNPRFDEARFIGRILGMV